MKKGNYSLFAYYLMDNHMYIEEFLKKNGMKSDNLRLKPFLEARMELIFQLKSKSNLSVREIAEVLKINRGLVERVKL